MDATLLTTDSEFPSHHVLKRFFSRCGFRVEMARSRGEWLLKAHALEPEVAVIDLDASWGGDAAVAAWWSELAPDAESPAVFILGNAPPKALARRTGMPSSACFQKPVAMERLLDRVGLAMAQLDLHRRTGPPRTGFRRPTQAVPNRTVP